MKIISIRGFTLMEVLVALAVLSIGLLGMAGMQLFSLTSNYDAYLRTQATYFEPKHLRAVTIRLCHLYLVASPIVKQQQQLVRLLNSRRLKLPNGNVRLDPMQEMQFVLRH